MDDSNRVEQLKEAYENDVIETLEEELDDELQVALNTSDTLGRQLWMSESKSEKPDPSELRPVDGEMHLPVKPKGGMWTSTYTPQNEYDSDWICWCSSEGFYGGRHKWLLESSDNLDVLVVDSLEDLQNIAKVYEKETYKETPSSSLRSTSLAFEQIALDFDAMRLTENGQKETRFTPINEPDLHGWDSECVLNFGWNWTSVEYLEKCDLTPRAAQF